MLKNYSKPVRIVGNGLTRWIAVNDKILPDTKSYNWSYYGQEPLNCGYEILNSLYGPELASKYAEMFTKFIVAQLPLSSFEISLELVSVLQLIDLNPTDRAYRAQEFMEFYAGGFKFSMFLYFVNGKFKTAAFKKGCIEFDKLAALTEEEFNVLVLYIKSSTGHRNRNNEAVHTLLYKSPIEDEYYISDGLGMGYFEGTKI